MLLPASEILSEEEVGELTGCVRHPAQVDWLVSHGWIFERARGGRPIVSRLYLRMRLAGLSVSEAMPAAVASEPNWAALG